MYYRTSPSYARGRGSGCSGRLIMAAAIALFSIISYFGSKQDNPITGETQYINITPEQEIALGLQAAPQMEQEFGGKDENANDQAIVDQVGNNVLQGSPASRSPYQFEFHLLNDDQRSMRSRCPADRFSSLARYTINFKQRENWLAYWDTRSDM